MSQPGKRPFIDSVSSARPRILGVRFGVNPNSSSLGVDVSFLLFGGAAAVAAGLFLSALLRGRRATPHGAGSGAEPKEGKP